MQRHARRSTGVLTPPTRPTVSAERRRQTDLPEKSVPARHTAPARASLAAVQRRERVDFKLALFIFRCLHGLAPRYLSDDIRRVADSNRRRLRSSSSALLTVRPRRLVTMGDSAFPVAGSRLWNSLPHEVTSASTLPVFCSRLKTFNLLLPL